VTPRDDEAKQQEKRSTQAGSEAAEAVADRTGVGGAKSDPAAVRRDIEETREQLGDTVEALSEKADVKAQAKAKVEERKRALREKQHQAKQKVSELRARASDSTSDDVKSAAARATATAQDHPGPAIAIAFAVGFVLAWLIRRS
jgi:ElaB/YqjD/DUF883 family membrane-anchored ribosome-binding protein